MNKMDEQKVHEILELIQNRLDEIFYDVEQVLKSNVGSQMFMDMLTTSGKLNGFWLFLSWSDRSWSIQFTAFRSVLIVNVSCAFYPIPPAPKYLRLDILPVKIYPLELIDIDEIIRYFKKEYDRILNIEEILKLEYEESSK